MQDPIFVSILALSWSTLVQFSRPFRNRVLHRRIIATVILFGVPGIQLFRSAGNIDIGLHVSKPGVTLLSALLFSGIAVAVNKYAEPNTSMYPQLRAARWTQRLFVINGVTWIFYLLAYELLFRGFLFFHCLGIFPLWLACLINIVLYALCHVPKGVKETLLCIPFGLLLCLLTWHTGNVWPAVIIHIALALSGEYYAVSAIRIKRQSTYAYRSQ